MRHELSIDVDAAPERVWTVLTDVQRWPSWTPSMTSVRRGDDGPLRVGSTAEIRQPKLPRAVWRVTEFEPGRRFAWATSNPGVTTIGDHRVEPLDGGRSRVTLAIDTTGPLSGLFWLLIGRLVRRYLELEATGLKRHCEASDQAS